MQNQMQSFLPKLNDDHLLNRLYRCISKIDKNTITSTAEMKYKSMYNEVHVDEKWLYLVKDGGQYILTADEVDPPLVSVAHKSHITKVMFLSACKTPIQLYNTRFQRSHWHLPSWRAGYVCLNHFYSQGQGI
jgi:hypothetical protein